MGHGAAPGERRGGRKKGVPNKRTQASIRKAQRGGTMPLDALLLVQRHWEGVYLAESKRPAKTRDEKLIKEALEGMRVAAKDAAPFLHATIKAQMNVPMSDAGKLAQAKDARAALARLLDQGAATEEAPGDPGRLN